MDIRKYFSKDKKRKEREENVEEREESGKKSTANSECQDKSANEANAKKCKDSIENDKSSGDPLETRQEQNVDVCKDISKTFQEMPTQPRGSFPKKQMGDRLRSFSSDWYKDYEWLEYSISMDKCFCFPYRHFGKNVKHGGSAFTNEGFNNWKKMRDSLQKHEVSHDHISSISAWLSVRAKQDITSKLTDAATKIDGENRIYLKKVAEVVVLCGHQGIALRGHREDLKSENRGNFLEILDVVQDKEFLAKLKSMPSNAKYLSPMIQNQILTAARTVVVKEIVSLIPDCYAVMADGCRDVGKIEQLSVCVRFLDSSDIIHERFLGFHALTACDAKAITSKIVEVLTLSGLGLDMCVAQSYDGASVMSSEHAGVCARLEDEIGHYCPYVHCYAHRLNLVIVDISKSFAFVEDFWGILDYCHNFFSAPKRHSVFQEVQRQEELEVRSLPDLSDTRWACRYTAIRVFATRLSCITTSLESISEWNGTVRAQAKGILAQIETFHFVMMLVIFEALLSVIHPLHLQLQTKDIDLGHAIKLVVAVQKTLREKKDFQVIWDKAIEFVEELGIGIALPQRRQLRQTPCGPKKKENAFQYYSRLFIEIVKVFSDELDRRFQKNSLVFDALMACTPSDPSFFQAKKLKPFLEKFENFSSGWDGLDAELEVGRNMVLTCQEEERPTSLTELFALFSPVRSALPRVRVMLKLLLTIPITTAHPERSFSCLRRLKTYQRQTTGEERLNDLGVLGMEVGLSKKIDLDKVVDTFMSQGGCRRIHL